MMSLSDITAYRTCTVIYGGSAWIPQQMICMVHTPHISALACRWGHAQRSGSQIVNLKATGALAPLPRLPGRTTATPMLPSSGQTDSMPLAERCCRQMSLRHIPVWGPTESVACFGWGHLLHYMMHTLE